MKKTNEEKARVLMNMDSVIRSINDEETGIFDSWIAVYNPDGSTYEDLVEILDNDDKFFTSACEFFSTAISSLIAEDSGWTTDGYTRAFFRSSDSTPFVGCPSCLNTGCVGSHDVYVDGSQEKYCCVTCDICGRTSLPEKTLSAAFESFYDNSLATIQQKDAVLLKMDVVNALINNGMCLTVGELWSLDSRKHT